MKNMIPMFRYSPFEVIEEEVPTSHDNFGYARSLIVKTGVFTQNRKNPKSIAKNIEIHEKCDSNDWI